MARKMIMVDFNDNKSIHNAVIAKAKAEYAGYSLNKTTQTGFNTFLLEYIKLNGG